MTTQYDPNLFDIKVLSSGFLVAKCKSTMPAMYLYWKVFQDVSQMKIGERLYRRDYAERVRSIVYRTFSIRYNAQYVYFSRVHFPGVSEYAVTKCLETLCKAGWLARDYKIRGYMSYMYFQRVDGPYDLPF